MFARPLRSRATLLVRAGVARRPRSVVCENRNATRPRHAQPLTSNPTGQAGAKTFVFATVRTFNDFNAHQGAKTRGQNQGTALVAQRRAPQRRAATSDPGWHTGLTFITNNGARMKYASLRAAGYPIGSGPTEGACKSFFSVRTKRSGQRWRNPGLRASLAYRSHLLNEHLPGAMRTLRRRDYTADVQPLTRQAA